MNVVAFLNFIFAITFLGWLGANLFESYFSCILLGGVISTGITLIINGHALADMIASLEKKFNFYNFFCVVLLEELFARWLCLEVLPKYLLPNPIVFPILFILGNLAWVAIDYHLHGNPWWRIDALAAGICYSVVFLKYGLLAAILSHLISNSLLLILHQVEKVGQDKDVITFMYSLILGVLGISYLRYLGCGTDKQISDMGFLDCFAWSVAILFALTAISTSLDQGQVTKKGNNVKLPKVWEVFLGIFLLGLLAGLGYLILGIFCQDMLSRAFLIAMGISFFSKPSSGSGRVRGFWSLFASSAVFLTILEAIGGAVIAVMLGHMVLRVPLVLLARHK